VLQEGARQRANIRVVIDQQNCDIGEWRGRFLLLRMIEVIDRLGDLGSLWFRLLRWGSMQVGSAGMLSKGLRNCSFEVRDRTLTISHSVGPAASF
jgi:hypothetical protein